MDKVKGLVEAGATLAEAVRSALEGRSFSEFALAHGLNRQNLTSALAGGVAPTREQVIALMDDLGGSAEEWLELFAQAAARRIRAVSV